jgi:hypothetical protein
MHSKNLYLYLEVLKINGAGGSNIQCFGNKMILTKMKMTDFWDVALCSLIKTNMLQRSVLLP